MNINSKNCMYVCVSHILKKLSALRPCKHLPLHTNSYAQTTAYKSLCFSSNNFHPKIKPKKKHLWKM